MTYTDTLDYLYGQLPMYQRQGAPALKKNLDNIKALLAPLGQPQQHYPTIHVAGTNGKGSVSHMLAGMLQATGLRVGLYTSPHYSDFRERIKIDAEYIPEQAVIDFVAEQRPLWEQVQPSFFEMTVAMAFEYFRKEQVDIAVIETGLGGRLDSTNVLQPILSVITNISNDHAAILGDTLPKIAAEKAGIIKPYTPVVIGQAEGEVLAVFRKKAAEEGAPLTVATDTYNAVPTVRALTHNIFNVYRHKRLYYKDLECAFAGRYQRHNATTAIAAMHQLSALGYSITEQHLRSAFRKLRSLTGFKGRFQTLRQRPHYVLADSAHNEAGLRDVLEYLEELDYVQCKHFVLGFVQDKNLDELLRLFPVEAGYYFCKPDVPRGRDAHEVVEIAARHGLAGRAYASVHDALDAAQSAAGYKHLVYVGGSTFVVAEVV